MTSRADTAVRGWIDSLPGVFRNRSFDGVIAVAHAHSRVRCDVNEFPSALLRAGYEPQQRRDPDGDGYFWLLVLPSPVVDPLLPGVRNASVRR